MRRASTIIAALVFAGITPARGAEYFQQWHHTTLHVKLDTVRKWVSGTPTKV